MKNQDFACVGNTDNQVEKNGMRYYVTNCKMVVQKVRQSTTRLQLELEGRTLNQSEQQGAMSKAAPEEVGSRIGQLKKLLACKRYCGKSQNDGKMGQRRKKSQEEMGHGKTIIMAWVENDATFANTWEDL